MDIEKLYAGQGARFVSPVAAMSEKMKSIKAFVFDWDGVFNTGEKHAGGSSTFNEVDSMGTNLLRYAYYFKNNQLPLTALISGEKNQSAFFFSGREHFHASYFKIAHKHWALEHFCKSHNIQPGEVCYFFDDVLDLSIARQVGLRILISRPATISFTSYCTEHALVDYITASPSGNFAIRESCEVLINAQLLYDDIITSRMHYDEQYQQYIAARNNVSTEFFTYSGGAIREEKMSV